MRSRYRTKTSLAASLALPTISAGLVRYTSKEALLDAVWRQIIGFEVMPVTSQEFECRVAKSLGRL
jgi:hypothetical protein